MTDTIAQLPAGTLVNNADLIPIWQGGVTKNVTMTMLDAGHAGGRTIIGGTAATDDLTLKSTSNAAPTDGSSIVILSGGTKDAIHVQKTTTHRNGVPFELPQVFIGDSFAGYGANQMVQLRRGTTGPGMTIGPNNALSIVGGDDDSEQSAQGGEALTVVWALRNGLQKGESDGMGIAVYNYDNTYPGNICAVGGPRLFHYTDTVWAAYSASVNYFNGGAFPDGQTIPGDGVSFSGNFYDCLVNNGPSSTVHSPSGSTASNTWWRWRANTQPVPALFSINPQCIIGTYFSTADGARPVAAGQTPATYAAPYTLIPNPARSTQHPHINNAEFTPVDRSANIALQMGFSARISMGGLNDFAAGLLVAPQSEGPGTFRAGVVIATGPKNVATSETWASGHWYQVGQVVDVGGSARYICTANLRPSTVSPASDTNNWNVCPVSNGPVDYSIWHGPVSGGILWTGTTPNFAVAANGNMTLAGNILFNDTRTSVGTQIIVNAGAPGGVVSAPVGSICLNTSGGAGGVLFVKEGGGAGNTGWVAK